ncbi:DUF1573 domain-containing protein [Dokdonia sinensis]|uniref:DUF1573 domain-containing protein n=1 Tax=Dokdonia sinensis TaxID=2479847 RepID=A0A3M0GMF0_9FLAO|nr:DUF1573 domain-containing protein [Dokdonia sinensis]RMB63892.1 DUF1573 domain-containing protein [Dokdonia sinensis]
MKKLMFLFVAGLLSFGIQAQEKKAEITFESDVVDYGEVEYGADGVREFKFTNTGDDVLIVARVYSTCGCTIPEKPEDPIQPGASDVIKVKYDTKRPGPIRKTITVYTNASETPYTLKIKGKVLPEASPLEKKGDGPINGN